MRPWDLQNKKMFQCQSGKDNVMGIVNYSNYLIKINCTEPWWLHPKGK
jgi:hypothetical protein